MKVIINACFGGFGLSAEAEELYAKKKGFNIYRYEQTKYEFRDGVELYERSDGKSTFGHTVTKDLGDTFNKFPNFDHYWLSSDIKRDDPVLIEVVELLGDKVSGECAKLKIVEIPDNIEWQIEEYDGSEHIAQKHETWC